jgi:predicted naringenin-chalcone synthase
LSKIISIATGVPQYKHEQAEILQFMSQAYQQEETENRKLRFLYNHAGIQTRYSVIPDYSLEMPHWKFFPDNEQLHPFPALEKRMEWFNNYAPALCVDTITKCIAGKILPQQITHLITVSCTGMSAPGLDLDIMEAMDLPKNIYRTSVNFMGCYAAVHALKMAHGIIAATPSANVIIVCLEFCTLHFQKNYTIDNITASLLFADGCAAMLVKNDAAEEKGLVLNNFYSEVSFKGKKDMAWELSSTGFLMTLTGYVSDLVEADFDTLVTSALANSKLNKENITHWCIHPGGKKILEAIERSIGIDKTVLQKSYDVLNDYGNMSSPTIIFVLQRHLQEIMEQNKTATVFGAAFGPGLTMETFTATYG